MVSGPPATPAAPGGTIHSVTVTTACTWLRYTHTLQEKGESLKKCMNPRLYFGWMLAGETDGDLSPLQSHVHGRLLPQSGQSLSGSRYSAVLQVSPHLYRLFSCFMSIFLVLCLFSDHLL